MNAVRIRANDISARRGRGGSSGPRLRTTVGGIANAAFEVAAAQMTFGLQMSR